MKRRISKESDEYGTPQWLFNLLNDEFNFELDVCASASNAKCPFYFDKKTDGLSPPWDRPYFCNPPYSDILPWAIKSTEMGVLGVHLVKHDPSTKHGAFYAEYADETWIPLHRIKFEGGDTGAKFPVAIHVMRRRLYTRKSGPRVLYVDYRELMKEQS